MASLNSCAFDVDKDLDDAALWAVIDSAAAASLSAYSATKSRKSLPLKHNSPVPFPIPSPQTKFPKNPRTLHNYSDGEVLQEPWVQHKQRPQKIARTNSRCVSELSEASPPPLAIVKHVQRTPTTPPVHSSPETRSYAITSFCTNNNNSPCASDCSPVTTTTMNHEDRETDSLMRHSLSGSFPTVSLFKEYQQAAMAILEKGDYTVISGYHYIKKSGWRKIAFYFNLSFEIKDKTIEFDDNRNVQRAEFVVRAYMQGGRFSDGWGSCERREKRFLKPNHDIPSTAETRAKNKACQDLLGIGEYRPGASHAR
ncbi:hypothetical protein ACH5RR_004853 [Cinchona calisaya]|uniref:Uncharacterized protein n=1 Tax=Cinchona calisaya TaxID=153742 RepID=A0ABD3AYQ6_9GENT